MTTEGQNIPDHERAYRALRDQVLHGELAPGQPVTIQGLTEALGLGMTPVREAIRRLTSQGALVFKGNRRVEVPMLSLGDYEQLAYARLAIEPELARRAVVRAVKTGDTALLARLEAEDALVDAAIARGDVGGYLAHNHAFHHILYAASGAEVLVGISETLWLRSGPGLRVVLGRQGTSNLPDKHLEALAAIRAGDADACATAIAEDIAQGIGQVTGDLAP